MRKVVITGAAGLVGQNLVARLKTRPDLQLIGIDKHPANIGIFRRVHPAVELIEADLAEAGGWMDALQNTDTLVLNQAQIGGLFENEFIANNITATKHLLDAAKRHSVPYIVHMSSSVVNSAADDFYTQSKTAQEAIVAECGVPHVVLRPTLMFGWFDRKHLGWLRRFMDKSIVFPIPGEGKYPRQPLYVGDMAQIISSCIDSKRTGTYDISGLENIDYGDLIELIHSIVKPRARIVHIPYAAFWGLLWLYSLFDKNPPFTTRQLEALVIPETFPVIDWPGIFNIPKTPLRQALTETYLDPRYSEITLAF